MLLTLSWREQTTANVDLSLLIEEVIQVWSIRLKIQQRLRSIRERKENWDECGSKKPNGLSLVHAENLLSELLDAVIAASRPWLTPFISSDEDGHITVAWHKGEHELHLEISEDDVEYVTVWGIKIDTEMDVGVLSRDNFLTLWNWLLDG